MGRILAALLGLLLLSAGQVEAQPNPRARVCAPTNSEKATVAAIASDPGTWIGRCVSVEAIYSGERLHADADAIYGANGNSIGGYVDGKGDVAGAWRGTFTGRVADCAQAEEDLLTGLLRSPGISLNGRTLGCLEPKGPFLVFMSQGELKDAKLKRRLPGAKGGDLAPTPADWPHRSAVADLSAEFAVALEAGSVSDLTRLLGSAYQAERIVAGDIEVFSKLKPEMRVWISMFVDKDVTGDRMAAESCRCLKADCGKRWPIDSRDADNQKTRPYVCIRIEGWREGDAWRYRVDASQDVWGLPEP